MTLPQNVAGPLGEALNKREYSELTPVQSAVLAPELRDADMLVSAQTGSGKTVAFGLALAPTLLGENDRFARTDTPLALAIAPTRELALQVKRELDWLYEKTGAIITSCVGGMDMRTERRNLARGAHIVVGTPGRLCDHIKRGSLDMTGMKAIVLDEADEMLDLGFREDLEFILDAAPAERRTLMFSATVPRSIATLAKRYQRDAVRVSTTSDQKQHLDIEYRAFTVAANDRENAIINVLRFYEAKNAIVFCNTRATVNHMTARFSNRGFSVVALSGELSQGQRTHALQAMRDGRARVCIATDVAARGIDLPNLELVIHADLPKNREGLLHRSGRTGRAGRKGVSALIVPYNARRRTERLLDSASVKADWAKPPSAQDVLDRDNQRILEDPVFADPITEDEQEFVSEMMSRHQPEQIAVALMRLYRAAHSAPEELIDVAPQDQKPQNRRADFTDGVWFSVSVGRKQNAEPRWLLPMLCKAGGITKTEIGAIRIDQSQTYFELTPDCVDGFLAAIGPDSKVEKNVTITRLGQKPEMPQRGRGNNDKPYKKKQPFGNRKPSGDRKKPRQDRGFTPEADTAPREPAFQKRKKSKKVKPETGSDGKTPLKSKLSPAQKKRKKLKKQLRKQGRN
ncbi:MAG TPA: DEAD/DEAH box helicase [Rhizobiales bacterium]|nr:DEAD/DEAH box helicase [Hyphomicrobiales bacterium]